MKLACPCPSDPEVRIFAASRSKRASIMRWKDGENVGASQSKRQGDFGTAYAASQYKSPERDDVRVGFLTESGTAAVKKNRL
jgi:hypothetical protein